MDPFMENFLGLKGFGPPAQRRDVPIDKLQKFKGKLPDKLLEYWQAHGWCAYAKGLFWTVDPDEWDDVLESWIGDSELVELDSYYVIGRSAFGALQLWGTRTGASLKILCPQGMIQPSFDADAFARRGPDKALQLFFASTARDVWDLDDEQERPLFDRALAKLGVLDHQSIYGFVPAMPLGGEAKLENLQKLDARVHLDLLAQAADKRLLHDIGELARKAVSR